MVVRVGSSCDAAILQHLWMIFHHLGIGTKVAECKAVSPIAGTGLGSCFHPELFVDGCAEVCVLLTLNS